jgi:hypothetical protein
MATLITLYSLTESFSDGGSSVELYTSRNLAIDAAAERIKDFREYDPSLEDALKDVEKSVESWGGLKLSEGNTLTLEKHRLILELEP